MLLSLHIVHAQKPIVDMNQLSQSVCVFLIFHKKNPCTISTANKGASKGHMSAMTRMPRTKKRIHKRK